MTVYINPVGSAGAGNKINYIPEIFNPKNVRETKEDTEVSLLKSILKLEKSLSLIQRKGINFNLEEIKGSFITKYGVMQYRKISMSLETYKYLGISGKI